MNGKDLAVILIVLFLGVTFFVKFSWCLIGCLIITAIGALMGDSRSSTTERRDSDWDSSDRETSYSRSSDDDDDEIVDHRGVVVNGKLKEYYRNVEKTGIADTEYEQELKDGYRYCDDHEDYDDCHYGR